MSRGYRSGLKQKRRKKEYLKIGKNWYDDRDYGCWLSKRTKLANIDKKEMKQALLDYEIERIKGK